MLGLLGLAGFSIFSAAKERSNTPAWSVVLLDSLTREGRYTSVPGAASMHLFAARGEIESFQVSIRSAHILLTNGSVQVSNLTCETGAVIHSSQMELFGEHFVEVRKSSPDEGTGNRPLGKGWYPDALIPFVNPDTHEDIHGAHYDAMPFRVEMNENHPIWIDVHVPRDAEPCTYRGTVAVSTSEMHTSLPFDLTVWNFELPERPALQSSFGMHKPLSNDRKAQELLLQHRLSPYLVNASLSHQLTKKGLSTYGLWFDGGGNNKTCTMQSPPSVEAMHAEMKRHPSNQDLYVYTADEIDKCPGIFKQVREWGRNIHEAGLRQLVTVTPHPDLLDDGSGTGRSAVDIWVLLPVMYDLAKQRVEEVQKKGDQVWSYAALVQDNYSPKWEIDFAPLNYRIQPGFISQSLALTGILYWRVELFTDHPWEDVQTYRIDKYSYPGEGMLVYPGDAAGLESVVPSMRLKQIRDGVDDYDYVELLKHAGRSDWALNLARTVGQDWKHWTKDPAALLAVRRQMGEELNRLGSLLNKGSH